MAVRKGKTYFLVSLEEAIHSEASEPVHLASTLEAAVEFCDRNCSMLDNSSLDEPDPTLAFIIYPMEANGEVKKTEIQIIDWEQYEDRLKATGYQMNFQRRIEVVVDQRWQLTVDKIKELLHTYGMISTDKLANELNLDEFRASIIIGKLETEGIIQHYEGANYVGTELGARLTAALDRRSLLT